jgi:CRISPR-associated protein (TIGR02710 family)
MTHLFITVGGSHQPIVTAIRELQPTYVVFFCTGKDPATGKPGSRSEVEGKGNCLKALREDTAPSLPAIPVQCGLAEGTWHVVEVPADDLDAAFCVMAASLHDVTEHDAKLVADYTGGTKSMTAAMVLAALDHGNAQLQSVQGARANLVQVQDGSQYLASSSVANIRFWRDCHLALAGWQHYAWDQSALVLRSIGAPIAAPLKPRWQRAVAISEAFAAWDRFDHHQAWAMLEPYGSVVAQQWPETLNALRILAGRDEARRETAAIWDLWLNAQRRASACRYDDAVARIYRLVEWVAQWQLRVRKEVNTADVPNDLAQRAGIVANRDGRFQAGLHAAWRLLAETGEPFQSFWKAEQGALLDRLQARNHSILAHGTQPVSLGEWTQWQTWLNSSFVPLLRPLMQKSRVSLMDQLPHEYPVAWVRGANGQS